MKNERNLLQLTAFENLDKNEDHNVELEINIDKDMTVPGTIELMANMIHIFIMHIATHINSSKPEHDSYSISDFYALISRDLLVYLSEVSEKEIGYNVITDIGKLFTSIEESDVEVEGYGTKKEFPSIDISEIEGIVDRYMNQNREEE